MPENLEITGSQSKEKYIVFGSHGHIGSNLFSKLTKDGLTAVRGDRAGRVPLGTTRVFNLSSYGNKYGQKDLPEIYRANIDLPQQILVNAIDAKSIVLVSSSSVLLPTETPYSISKREMEENVKSWVAQTRDPVIVARPSTIVGIGEDSSHLIPKLIDSAFTQKEMDFVAEPTHDFLGVDDFVNGLIFLSKIADKYKGQVFNISFGISISNEQVLHIVHYLTERKPNIKRVKQMRNYDTTEWEVPNDKIRMLGWKPTKTIVDVIKEMVEDYKTRHNV